MEENNGMMMTSGQQQQQHQQQQQNSVAATMTTSAKKMLHLPSERRFTGTPLRIPLQRSCSSPAGTFGEYSTPPLVIIPCEC